ncbi:MAG TPA: HAMP domain-containing sensor histidine kinase [Terracidiphilus sp.]|nr:HAMP domain-containing sensor histidine kinase [Terracidiphilus sp.]
MPQSSFPLSGLRGAGDPTSPPSSLQQGSHTAHFYSDDESLLTEVGERIVAALQAGGSAIVIAEPSRRQSFARYLEAHQIDLVRVTNQGRWIALDAAGALAEFMVDGWPDDQRFRMLIGGVVDRLTAAATTPANTNPPVFAYGEMVTVLWKRGRQAAAIRLEELWCELGHTRTFHLSCGWPLSLFNDARDALVVDKLCALHTHVLPNVALTPTASGARPTLGLLWQLKANKVLQRVSSISRQTLGYYRDLSSPSLVNVQDAIEEILAMYQQRLRRRDITVRRKIHPRLEIFASLGEVKYILTKLVANAFDSSFQGATIYLSAHRSHHPQTGSHGVRISVGDQGLGLEPPQCAQVFDHYSTSRRDISIGLGLWTVKDLLERRGGYIRCRSKVTEPSGTIMAAFLPMHPAAAVLDGHRSSAA